MQQARELSGRVKIVEKVEVVKTERKQKEEEKEKCAR
jgi:hypothetical protein